MFDEVQATSTEHAERAVIGAALDDRSAIRWAAERVTADDFSNATLGAVWAILYARWKGGDPTDPISMDGALRGVVPGYQPGGVFDLMNAATIGGKAGHWAEIIAEGAKRRRAIEAGSRLVNNASQGDLADALATVKRDLEDIGKAATTRLNATMLADVLDQEDTEDWIIPGILERQERVIFTGGEGAGKTTLVRQMAILSAAGVNPFTFDDMPPVRVLVIDAENSEKQWRKNTRDVVGKASQRLGADVGQIFPLVCTVDLGISLDITKERDLSAIHDLIDAHRPEMVFIGPLYKITSRAIQTDDEATPVLRALDSIRARGITLVMEAHAGVPGQDGRNLRPRGSAALLGWPEFGIGLAVDQDYLPFQADPDNFKNRKVDLTRWRGDRDQGRAWPKSIYPNSYWRWGCEPYEHTMHYPNPRPQEAA